MFFKANTKMYSFISLGMQTFAEMEIQGDGKLVWFFAAGPTMTIRYTI
ncbi:MAG: hypothetical protein ACJA08_000991 [Cyclobacteriaceae bacterium]|jgi:hypothetical protein